MWRRMLDWRRDIILIRDQKIGLDWNRDRKFPLVIFLCDWDEVFSQNFWWKIIDRYTSLEILGYGVKHFCDCCLRCVRGFRSYALKRGYKDFNHCKFSSIREYASDSENFQLPVWNMTNYAVSSSWAGDSTTSPLPNGPTTLPAPLLPSSIFCHFTSSAPYSISSRECTIAGPSSDCAVLIIMRFGVGHS